MNYVARGERVIHTSSPQSGFHEGAMHKDIPIRIKSIPTNVSKYKRTQQRTIVMLKSQAAVAPLWIVVIV